MRIDAQSLVSGPSEAESFDAANSAAAGSDFGSGNAAAQDGCQKIGGASSGSQSSSGGSMSGGGGGEGLMQSAAALQETLSELKEMIEDLAQMIASMSGQGQVSGASRANEGGGISSVDSGSGGHSGSDGHSHSDGHSGSGRLGGTQGPSDRIPAPTDNVREIQLGGRTVTVGGDGSASAGEVDATAAELENLYNNSPSFKQTIDNSSAEELVVTVGRRGDNISWGGGGRVFMNVNNIQPGSNDTFQELMAHEFGHAAAGLEHGSTLDNLSRSVANEA